MKIGSHSGLLSRLINILSAKAALVWEQEEPPQMRWQEAWGQGWGLPGWPLHIEAPRLAGRWLGSSKGLSGCSSLPG